MATAPAEFLAGAGLLGRGMAMMVRRPRLFWLGAVPPLITSVIFTGVVILLVAELKPIVGWLTSFASAWSPGSLALLQVLVGVGVVAGSVLLMVLTFSALTLALGSPIYDRISEAVDRELGGTRPPLDEPIAVAASRAVRQSVALIAASLLGAAALLLLGLIPVVGQIAGAVGSASFGGWMLCLELVGSPLERRHLLTIADRRALLRGHRWRTLGLGIPTFLLLSIPFVAVVLFPAATAAGTILARQLLDEPTQAPARTPGAV
jgi:CysZ protein